MLKWFRRAGKGILAAGLGALIPQVVLDLWLALSGASGRWAVAPGLTDKLAKYGLWLLLAGLVVNVVLAEKGKRLSWVAGLLIGYPVFFVFFVFLSLGTEVTG